MDLIVTKLVAELRKVRSGKADPGVRPGRTEWILLTERRHPTQRDWLRQWLHQAVIVTDTGLCRARPGGGYRRGPEEGRTAWSRPQAVRDGLIAATALVHSLVLVTRNLADSAATGVPLLNPWELRETSSSHHRLDGRRAGGDGVKRGLASRCGR